MPMINFFNKAHYTITIEGYKFPPFKEITLNLGYSSDVYRSIRCNHNIRCEKIDNKGYAERNGLVKGSDFNFIYDNVSQHAGEAYIYAIEALAKPIFENLPDGKAGFYNKPVPGPKEKGVNCRFFNSSRINEQGKCSVGPHDVFISHGIGDKNYWKASKISDFNYAFCPGPAWEKRIYQTGYKGQVFQVGYTKLDPIFQGKIKKNKYDKPVIAWLPTHGYGNKHKGRSSHPFFEKYLKEISSEYIVINGKHPTTKMHSNKKQLPTMHELVDADIVIADAGSTVYEAWALGKPVIFPDWICKKDVEEHFCKDKNNLEYILYTKSIGYHAKDMKHLNELIEKALQDGMKDEEKEFIEEIFPEKYRGNSGKIAAMTLTAIRKTF